MTTTAITREDILDLPMLTTGELIAQIDFETHARTAPAEGSDARMHTLTGMVADRARRGCTVAAAWIG